jgi:hypothetical protein
VFDEKMARSFVDAHGTVALYIAMAPHGTSACAFFTQCCLLRAAG